MSADDLSKHEVSKFISEVAMCGVDALWYKTYDLRPHVDFETRKKIFLHVLTAILEAGHAKLQRKDQMLDSSVDEQVMDFERAWPSEEDWDRDFFWMSKSGVGWTPSGLVWMASDGSEFWT